MKLEERCRKWIINFQYLMLFLTILTLPVFSLTKSLQIINLGGKLSWYFALLGVIALAIEWLLFRFKIDKTIKIFFIIFLGWQVLSLVIGLYQYPYYQESNWHQSTRLSYIIDFIENHDIDFMTINQIEAIWLAMRVIKNTLLEFIFTFGITMWTVHLFRDSFNRGFVIIRKFVLALALVLGIYAIPEILFFKFKMTIGYDILSVTNGFLYDVGSHLGWYPPLIWGNEQIRSYCTEPSIFGFLAATIIPMFWSCIKINFKIAVFYIYYIMLIFMTKARTANAVAIIDFFFLLPGIIYGKTRKLAITLVILSGLGFMCNIGMNFVPALISDISSSVSNSENAYSYYEDSISSSPDFHSENVYSYYENNVKSIVDKESRSNGSRLINVIGHINVIKSHWAIGVGNGLEACYVRDNLPEGALENQEIRSITNELNENGPLGTVSYGNVNHYIYLLTNGGLVGLVIYLVPFMYVLWMIFKLKLWKNNRYIFLTIILIGNLASGMAGEPVMLLYIILGLSYIGIQENLNLVNKEMEV